MNSYYIYGYYINYKALVNEENMLQSKYLLTQRPTYSCLPTAAHGWPPSLVSTPRRRVNAGKTGFNPVTHKNKCTSIEDALRDTFSGLPGIDCCNASCAWHRISALWEFIECLFLVSTSNFHH